MATRIERRIAGSHFEVRAPLDVAELEQVIVAAASATSGRTDTIVRADLSTDGAITHLDLEMRRARTVRTASLRFTHTPAADGGPASVSFESIGVVISRVRVLSMPVAPATSPAMPLLAQFAAAVKAALLARAHDAATLDA